MITDMVEPRVLEVVDLEVSSYNFQVYNPSFMSNILDLYFNFGDSSTYTERRVQTLSTVFSLIGGMVGILQLIGNFIIAPL